MRKSGVKGDTLCVYYTPFVEDGNGDLLMGRESCFSIDSIITRREWRLKRGSFHVLGNMVKLKIGRVSPRCEGSIMDKREAMIRLWFDMWLQ